MSPDEIQSKELDPDRTDQLPILEGTILDQDVADDAVPMERAPVSAVPLASPGPETLRVASDFARPPAVDLPSLTESVRSVEERIARQSAEHEALSRLYEKTRNAEGVAAARVNTLTEELAAARSALAMEQHRFQEAERALAEKNITAEHARKRADELIRDWERYQNDIRSMRDSLAARDATVVQVLHSLGERDAQLYALQREHAKVVPALEARSQASVLFEAEIQALQSDAEASALELKEARRSLSALAEQIKRGEHELNVMRQELGAVERQAGSYLEVLRTREWRRGFDQNRFLEWDAKMSAASAGHEVLLAERDRLKQTAAALSGKLVEQEEAIANLRSASAVDAAALAKSTQELKERERAREEFAARSEELEAECQRLRGEIAARDHALAEARALTSAEAQQVAQLKAEAETHEEELTVLMAHLNEARRPIQSIQADLKRANDELALNASSVEQLSEENRNLHATLERTRGALQEREFLIRRLERSESHNANALGRIQTSIERLGTTPAPTAGPALSADWPAEFVRIDDGHEVTYALGRRTRVGRAPDCELHIDSQSVSRHHALVLKGLRDLIIEDLNSTNGVIVNGRKVSRLFLSDGDVVTIGETQFRCALNPAKRQPEAPPEPPSAGPHSAES
jgi:chromosome segregation ATPase